MTQLHSIDRGFAFVHQFVSTMCFVTISAMGYKHVVPQNKEGNGSRRPGCEGGQEAYKRNKPPAIGGRTVDCRELILAG
jgi:hypothetical protein